MEILSQGSHLLLPRPLLSFAALVWARTMKTGCGEDGNPCLVSDLG